MNLLISRRIDTNYINILLSITDFSAVTSTRIIFASDFDCVCFNFLLLLSRQMDDALFGPITVRVDAIIIEQ